jgi:hypothetical protein
MRGRRKHESRIPSDAALILSGRYHSSVAFALHPFAHQFPVAPDGLGPLAGFPFGRLFIGTAELHFPEHAFALHLLLQGAQRLIDVVVANDNLNDVAYSCS